MEEIEDLTEGEQKAVAGFLGTLAQVNDNPPILRRMALEGLVDIFAIKGYCTLLWMNRFFSNRGRKGTKGRVYNYFHVNNPPAWLELLWDRHIRKASSIIEEAIYEKFSGDQMGF